MVFLQTTIVITDNWEDELLILWRRLSILAFMGLDNRMRNENALIN
jgi:hypothetical protein